MLYVSVDHADEDCSLASQTEGHSCELRAAQRSIHHCVMRASVLVLLIAVSSLFTSTLAATGAKAQMKIAVGTEGADAPWNFTTANGQLRGMEIEFISSLCDRIQAVCSISAMDWNGLIPSLKSGTIDVIIGNLSITEERLKIIGFTDPYAISPSGFIAPNNSPLANLNSIVTPGIRLDLSKNHELVSEIIESMKPFLKGRIVGAQAGTNDILFLKKYFSNTIEIRSYFNKEQQRLDLAVGRIDAMFMQEASVDDMMKPIRGDTGIELTGPTFFNGILGRGIGIGVRKGETHLTKKLNKAIAFAITNGELKSLFVKWFKRDLTP